MNAGQVQILGLCQPGWWPISFLLLFIFFSEQVHPGWSSSRFLLQPAGKDCPAGPPLGYKEGPILYNIYTGSHMAITSSYTTMTLYYTVLLEL